ncbi:myosin heavy chain-like protein [Parasponia andersonii]|uniref:Myosin heavy chain-like protein n=1 Tax=Parasponia andersonii TaxID=3476 RepID=A0A2P5DEB5_PARAD|nr:myosin heavy chain-like protein [Parasponia andersonii]
MSGLRAFSSPELSPSPKIHGERSEDHSFEGIATNIKLLLKLVQDHNEAGTRDGVDDRKSQRVAGMMSIIEDVKTRIQKSQSSGRKPELRRCNTDLLRSNNGGGGSSSSAPRDNTKKSNELPINDEKERLKRQLSMSLAARKSLEILCGSLGKEKEIIASELSRKVQECASLEELVSDLRAQNDMLLGKVKACAAEHKERRSSSGVGETSQGNAALQERNRALSEQLLKSLDGYRSLKRKLKDSQEESVKMEVEMEKMGVEVQDGIERIQTLKEKIGKWSGEKEVDIDEEIKALEGMFECFNLKISKHREKKSASPKKKNETKVNKATLNE